MYCMIRIVATTNLASQALYFRFPPKHAPADNGHLHYRLYFDLDKNFITT